MKLVAKKTGEIFRARARGGQAWAKPLWRVTRLPRQCLKRKKSRSAGCTPGPSWFAAQLGAAGIRQDKREGDRATPWRSLSPSRRLFPTRTGFCAKLGFRRCAPPGQATAGATIRAARCTTGAWGCLAGTRHEKLWRADRLYDLVIILDYNIHPRRKNRGSAIFLHCARGDFAPTGGLHRASPRRSAPAAAASRAQGGADGQVRLSRE